MHCDSKVSVALELYTNCSCVCMCVCVHCTALVEAEQRRGGKGRSASDIRSLIARKKKLNSKITHGLPNWGEGLPQDVRLTRASFCCWQCLCCN